MNYLGNSGKHLRVSKGILPECVIQLQIFDVNTVFFFFCLNVPEVWMERMTFSRKRSGKVFLLVNQNTPPNHVKSNINLSPVHVLKRLRNTAKVVVLLEDG